MRNLPLICGVSAVFLAGVWWYLNESTQIVRNDLQIEKTQSSTGNGHEEIPPFPLRETQGASFGEENTVEFSCAEGKSLIGVFARDILGLTLSDGRQIELRQVVSGSGIRYLNNIQTIEFRGQGDDAFLIENGITTYADCKA